MKVVLQRVKNAYVKVDSKIISEINNGYLLFWGIEELDTEIESEILSFTPDLLVTHNPVEVNLDHIITFKAVEAATRPIKGNLVPTIWGCEIPCSGRWTLETKFVPNIYVEIDDFIEMKILAWSKYEGEARKFPFPHRKAG